eukprot:jgi/Ulvmu1/7234/UM035_0021.1
MQCTTRQQTKALDSSQTIAISQQLTAWAILVAGEGGWAWQRLSPQTPGRPSLPITAFIAGSTIADVVLFQFEGTQRLAEVLGIVASAVAMAYYVKRCLDTTGSPSDWPGPKAPVAGMALVAFFALNICLQGLRT